MSKLPLPELSPTARAGLFALAEEGRERHLRSRGAPQSEGGPHTIQIFAALLWIRRVELDVQTQAEPDALPSSPATLPLSVRLGLAALARRVQLAELLDHLAAQGASRAEVLAVEHAVTYLLQAELPAKSEREGA